MNNDNFLLLTEHDVITKEQQDNIESLTTSQYFPWFFSHGTILPEDINENNNNLWIINIGSNPFQFVHVVSLDNCPFLDTIAPVLNAIAVKFQSNLKIIKIKFNLLTQSTDKEYHLPHTDTDENESACYTSIYYVNDSDGDTYLFNEFGPKSNDDNHTIFKTISPSKGSLLVFDAKRFHASSSPILNDKRIVMNIVFKVQP